MNFTPVLVFFFKWQHLTVLSLALFFYTLSLDKTANNFFMFASTVEKWFPTSFCLTTIETKATVLFMCSCYLYNSPSHKKKNQKSLFCSNCGVSCKRHRELFPISDAHSLTYSCIKFTGLFPMPYDHDHQLQLLQVALCFSSFLPKKLNYPSPVIPLYCENSVSKLQLLWQPQVCKIHESPKWTPDLMLCPSEKSMLLKRHEDSVKVNSSANQNTISSTKSSNTVLFPECCKAVWWPNH